MLKTGISWDQPRRKLAGTLSSRVSDRQNEDYACACQVGEGCSYVLSIMYANNYSAQVANNRDHDPRFASSLNVTIKISSENTRRTEWKAEYEIGREFET